MAAVEVATEELPTLHQPGDEKFISYKNMLQQYCQKKQLSLPQYSIEKQDNGLVGVLTCGDSVVRSTLTAGSVKEAEAHVAYESLQKIGYMKAHIFDMSTYQTKRKSADTAMPQNGAKKVKSDTNAPTSKSQLNEYSHKKQIPIPVYKTEPTEGGFSSTVSFNNQQYNSTGVCRSRKSAEQNAAQVVLNALTGAPLPVLEEPMETTTTPASVKSTPVMPVGPKNRLQEHCQKLKKELPTYESKKLEESGNFISTVTVENNAYMGPEVESKKKAEGAAAEVALIALGVN